MQLQAILRDLVGTGGGDTTFDGPGPFELLLDGDGRLLVDPREEAGALFLRVPLEIGRRGEEDQIALYRRLLEAQLLGAATGGCVFSLDEEEERLELHLRLPLGDSLTAEAFGQAVATLLGVARDAIAQHGLAFAREEDWGAEAGEEEAEES